MIAKPYADFDGPIADLENLIALEQEAAALRDAIDRIWKRFDRLEHILGGSDDDTYGLIRGMDVETDGLIKLLAAAREKCENRLDACLDIPDEDEGAVE